MKCLWSGEFQEEPPLSNPHEVRFHTGASQDCDTVDMPRVVKGGPHTHEWSPFTCVIRKHSNGISESSTTSHQRNCIVGYLIILCRVGKKFMILCTLGQYFNNPESYIFATDTLLLIPHSYAVLPKTAYRLTIYSYGWRSIRFYPSMGLTKLLLT